MCFLDSDFSTSESLSCYTNRLFDIVLLLWCYSQICLFATVAIEFAIARQIFIDFQYSIRIFAHNSLSLNVKRGVFTYKNLGLLN